MGVRGFKSLNEWNAVKKDIIAKYSPKGLRIEEENKGEN